jgi:hypothetical protein
MPRLVLAIISRVQVRIISTDIGAGKFYKRAGKHCGYCDFLPVCLGDKKKIKETLVKIT